LFIRNIRAFYFDKAIDLFYETIWGCSQEINALINKKTTGNYFNVVYMLIFQPPVNFCSDKNIQTIFGTKLEDFLNYRIGYNLISQTVEKVVKKILFGRRNNSTSSGRQSSAIVGSTST
jgi:hypothetical protein